MNRNSLPYVVLFSFIVTALFVTVLAAAHLGTRERVLLAEERRLQEAVLHALKTPASGEEARRTFARLSVAALPNGTRIYRTPEPRSYAVELSGPGLWGTIRAVVGISGDLSRILGLAILEQNETPGLGGRITEPWFLSQFEGERIGPDGIAVRQTGRSGDPDPDNSLVDGITGATRTSQAIETLVDRAITTLKEALPTLSEEDFAPVEAPQARTSPDDERSS
ncbi:FMN-binding domain protein [Spirochaeta thermophila DSM 6578]|uniref:Ion-translocating oxidoreductase complex subunit G n=1 Tax=Winmispira thermophila (strain ATCC 700085 / DSM 6578 / Z-1203) TaxID=869211 RepID=G0GDF6_WINT7|nr:FMN-binding protein [Spirochaeta thermophila]AEJ60582.1 FMN-binding domain protein [Spirochaeta thermophila DSM 6578]